jgi:hypothetical protein
VPASPQIVTCRSLSRSFLGEILVNLDDPDDHWMFKVYHLKPMITVKKQHYEGYAISLPSADRRWYAQDPHEKFFSARLVSPNQVLIRMIAYDYDHVHNLEFVETKHNRDTGSKMVTQAMESLKFSINAANNRREKNGRKLFEEYKWKHYVLTFPEDHTLSVKEIQDEDEEDALALYEEFHDICTFYERPEYGNGIHFANSKDELTWYVIKKEERDFDISSKDVSRTGKSASRMGYGSPQPGASGAQTFQAQQAQHNSRQGRGP